MRRFVETLTTGNLSLKSFLSSTGTQISYLQHLLLIIQEINKVKIVHIRSEKLSLPLQYLIQGYLSIKDVLIHGNKANTFP